jgi:pimeloyl-ACP methyl ester carboxylesterase
MTRFLDLRLGPVGGELSRQVAVNQGTSIADYTGLSIAQLLDDIRGQHVLIGTHGFNVDREHGIGCLSNWERLLQFTAPSVFVGLLWPGDSIWLHGLDYPQEPKIADDAGQLIAPFLDANLQGAASVSFVSHSLGARVVLAAVSKLSLPVRRVMLMAGAIDDDCFNTEFQALAAKVEKISVLASKKDRVLSVAFPLGDLAGGIIAAGHPWWHSALGRTGPSAPAPPNFQAPFEIPDNWNFDHGSYLAIDAPPIPVLPLPTDVPPNGTLEPAGGADGWSEAFTAAFCSTRFQ